MPDITPEGMPLEDLALIKQINATACACGHPHTGVVTGPSGTVYLVIASSAGEICAAPIDTHIELRGIGAMLLDASDTWEINARRLRDEAKAREN